jgi:dTDP-4-dehydrorhamnose reductase
MNVLVLGGSGMLGQALLRRLPLEGLSATTLRRAEFDATNPSFSRIDAVSPDAVVNAIGMVNRRLDRGNAEFLLVNSLFPRRLADHCTARGIPLIHVSTDCVFSGRLGPYVEGSTDHADDLYGRSKRWGEPTNALVIRTSIVGPETQNFYSLLCWFLGQAGPVKGFSNHLWNGVTTWELARIVAQLLNRKSVEPGLMHVHGEDLSKLELLRLMANAYRHRVEIVPFNDEHARDTRLATSHPQLLKNFNVQPMATQLAEIARLSDPRGCWEALV